MSLFSWTLRLLPRNATFSRTLFGLWQTEVGIPFTVGGGIRSVEDARVVLCNGADKVSINTAPVENPGLVSELAEIFGRQCVVVAIDAKRRFEERSDKVMVNTFDGSCWFEVHTYGGTGGKPTGIDALRWAEQVEELGAGSFS